MHADIVDNKKSDQKLFFQRSIISKILHKVKGIDNLIDDIAQLCFHSPISLRQTIYIEDKTMKLLPRETYLLETKCKKTSKMTYWYVIEIAKW